ncbi:hypothetical protein NQ317_019800 [Molorchus minor]|uniref:Uncharacterized protein n=1 Tax=Molorchus minor TaxID=1323400 RepID=A0ABQ9JDI4_9CUCU|nr:hypothetical protein NQ317_019800 [Molorchus minor]
MMPPLYALYLQRDDFYLLNAYFLKQRLTITHEEIQRVSEPLTEVWPPGQRPVPSQRHGSICLGKCTSI